jgi:hypothetical protein
MISEGFFAAAARAEQPDEQAVEHAARRGDQHDHREPDRARRAAVVS